MTPYKCNLNKATSLKVSKLKEIMDEKERELREELKEDIIVTAVYVYTNSDDSKYSDVHKFNVEESIFPRFIFHMRTQLKVEGLFLALGLEYEYKDIDTVGGNADCIVTGVNYSNIIR